MIIAVDLDNTLTDGNPTICNGELDEDIDRKLYCLRPDRKTISKVNKKYDQGHTIIIYTARRTHSKKVTERWLKENGVKYSYLSMNKLRADLYVDRDSCKPEEL